MGDAGAPEAREDKNSLYDDASDDLWRLAVYEPVHGGWEFANMAGARLLDYAAIRLRLDAGTRVLELCSGAGAVGRYLVTRFGCPVTGVEVNRAQWEYARKRAGELPVDRSGLLRFVHADLAGWEPDQLYDVVLALDSISLLGDFSREVFRLAFRALRPGGRLVISDMSPGPFTTTDIRARIWDYDGIRPLPEPEGLRALLRASGFTDVELTDITGVAADCYRRIVSALKGRAAEAVAVAGPDRYREWLDVCTFYRELFETGGLAYQRCLARRPAGP